MNISKEQFTNLAKEHLIALESYKMDKNGNNPIEIFGIEKLYDAINYTHSCTELRDKEAPNIEDWLKDNFKRLDRHSFTNTHEDTIWLRSELVEVYNQLHP